MNRTQGRVGVVQMVVQWWVLDAGQFRRPGETIKAVAALLKPGTPKHSHMLLTALSSGYRPLRQKAL